MIRIFIIVVMIVLVIHFIATIIGNKVNNKLYVQNLVYERKIELFKRTLLFVEAQLGLLELEGCPDSERIEIPKEIRNMIKEIKGSW